MKKSPQNLSHEFRVLLTNGTVVQIARHELRQFVYGKYVFALMLAFLVGIIASNPTISSSVPDVRTRLVYWILSIALYMLLLPFWADLVFGLWWRISSRPLPLILATGPLIVGLNYFAVQLPDIFGNWQSSPNFHVPWQVYAKNLLLAHCVETVALLLLLPFYRRDRADALEQEKALSESARSESALSESESDPAPEPQADEVEATVPPAHFVVLGGRTLPASAIRLVQSSEHYLLIVTNPKTIEIRARMKDFIEQVNEDLGIQTHRSFWVSAAEAQELEGQVVKTRSGTDVPVARGRMMAVRDWFVRQGKLL